MEKIITFTRLISFQNYHRHYFRNMKKILTTIILFSGITTFIYGQSSKATQEESNCYLKWAKKFEERGATDVEDGTYTDVIITFRRGSDAECYNGKCDVKEKKIAALYTKMEDGSYKQVKKKLRYDGPITITNGISSTLLTMEEELINVLFIKKIKPKEASFEKAPEPEDD